MNQINIWTFLKIKLAARNIYYNINFILNDFVNIKNVICLIKSLHMLTIYLKIVEIHCKI